MLQRLQHIGGEDGFAGRLGGSVAATDRGQVVDDAAETVELPQRHLGGVGRRILLVRPQRLQQLEVPAGHRQRRTQLVGDRGQQLLAPPFVVADPVQHPVELPRHGGHLVLSRRLRHPRLQLAQPGRASCGREIVHRLKSPAQGQDEKYAAHEQTAGAGQPDPGECLAGLLAPGRQRAEHRQRADGSAVAVQGRGEDAQRPDRGIDGGEGSGDSGRQCALALQLLRRGRAVAGAEHLGPDLDHGQVAVTARIDGQVAPHRKLDLRGVGHTVGALGRFDLGGQTEPDLGQLLFEQPVQVLAVFHADQLLGQHRRHQQGQRHHAERDGGDPDQQRGSHRSAIRYPARRTVSIRSAPILRRRCRM